jgi:hypothetical protein
MNEELERGREAWRWVAGLAVLALWAVASWKNDRDRLELDASRDLALLRVLEAIGQRAAAGDEFTATTWKDGDERRRVETGRGLDQGVVEWAQRHKTNVLAQSPTAPEPEPETEHR